MSTADPGALGVLLSELVDDAALFPPGDVPMADAVPAHFGYEAGAHSGMLGRFLCPATAERLAELDAAVRAADVEEQGLRLGLIASDVASVIDLSAFIDRDDRYMLETVELRHPGGAGLDWLEDLPYGVEAYIEIAPADMRSLLPTLAGEFSAHAKLRTGGLAAEAFPTPLQVAEFLVGCADLEVSVKCTAGLHNAIRHTDAATGFTHHGFLNVLLAACLASDGAEVEDVRRVLELADGAVVAEQIKALTVEDAARTRDLFHGFGSCSFTEPVDDLVALGLLSA